MSLTIEEFDIKELTARPLGGKLIHGLKTVNFYYGDHKRVPNVRVKGIMKVTKGKFRHMLKIDLNEESEEFFKSVEDQLRILAGGYLIKKPWDFKFPSREYGPFRVIHCKIYSSCQLVNLKLGELFRGYCEMKPYHTFSGKTKGITLVANKIVR